MSVHTIRQWVRRGHLPVAGYVGRHPMFFLADLFAASDGTRKRGGTRVA